MYQKERFNETADNATKYLKVIDSKIDPHIKDDWYYGLLLFKGMATYRLRDYKTSTPIFKRLTEYDSKNDNYKNWLSYSKYGKRLWISKTIVVVCVLLFLIENFFKQDIKSFYLRILTESVFFIGLVGTIVYDYYIGRSFRKTKLK